MSGRPRLALTQGDPAGIGPEIILKLAAAGSADRGYAPLLICERRALEAALHAVPEFDRERLVYLDGVPDRATLDRLNLETIAVIDPVGDGPPVVAGRSRPADAAGAVAAIDLACDLVTAGVADAIVTAPVSKESISTQHLEGFRGHTDYIARRAGLERYGRDYLMAFLTPDLQVALLSTHVSLVEAIRGLQIEPIVEALVCLNRSSTGRIALAALNPHASEGGLMGDEEARILEPAVLRARESGVDVSGPESADSLFARARRGAFDWVLALYHDQGLIAVKTSAFGASTNWTLGLPFVRTSVDHGTAFEIAGRGVADARPLAGAVEATLGLLSGRLPRSSAADSRRPELR